MEGLPVVSVVSVVIMLGFFAKLRQNRHTAKSCPVILFLPLQAAHALAAQQTITVSVFIKGADRVSVAPVNTLKSMI